MKTINNLSELYLSLETVSDKNPTKKQITETEKELAACAEYVRGAVSSHYDFTDSEFSAVVMFCLNMGVDELSVLLYHNKFNKGQIADNWITHINRDGKKDNKLIKRRKKELELFLS